MPVMCLGVAVAPALQAADAPAILAPVVVTTSRTEALLKDVPASASVVDGETMRDMRPQINLSESLGAVPGLQIQNRQNYAQDLQISIRGFGARSTFGIRGLRVYVDGIPATLPDGQGQTSNIDISSADRVEILRGPFSALYGNSSGGVMQVFTQDGKGPPTLGASFSAGSYGTWRYGLKATGELGTAGRAGQFDYVLDVNRMTTEGYRDHSAARKNLANARLGWRLDDDSTLTMTLNSVDLTAQDPLGLRRDQFDTSPRSAALAQEYNTRKTVSQTQGGLLYERRIDADNQFRAMLYYGSRSTTQYQSIPPAPQLNPTHAGGVIDLDRDYGGADVRWTHRRTMGGRPVVLIAGLAYDSLAERRKGYNNFTGTGAQQVVGVMGALRRDEDNTVSNLDPYVQASWQFLDKWTLEGGLRYSTIRFKSDDNYIAGANGDDSGSTRFRKALPVASLRYAATERLNLYATAGRGFETPTLNELSYRPDQTPGLNFALQPATNTTVEVGAKSTVAGGLLTAALFRTTTDDEIVTASNTNGRSTFQNAGRTRRQGVELGWDGYFHDQWRAQVAYTWLDAQYRDTVCAAAPCASPAITSGARMPGVARQSAFASVGWVPPKGFRATVEGRYLSKVFVDDRNSDASPSYMVAALAAGYVANAGPWRLNLSARVDNLFDRRYAGSVIVNETNTRYFEPAPGRNWMVGGGATYTF
ncbi:TonB-dependent receptor [Pigmentiphaga litoralis]|uniref:TonB-dependent receptor family protein n=1 Tax=Pigmentiphaga litoralis TaxID=516702 RepID=UPI001674F3A4|nr:TonB-dependent receptor [Pigmentiphaga litoralis]